MWGNAVPAWWPLGRDNNRRPRSVQEREPNMTKRKDTAPTMQLSDKQQDDPLVALARTFKPYFVRRVERDGDCQVLFPLSRLDALMTVAVRSAVNRWQGGPKAGRQPSNPITEGGE